MADHDGARSPRSGDAAKAEFRTLVPDDPRVTVRPMFGSLAAFIEGQMFMGLYADELFVRLGDDERKQVFDAGGGQLEPMPGRPMREYVTVPAWRDDHALVRRWAGSALRYALTLPPKKGR